MRLHCEELTAQTDIRELVELTTSPQNLKNI
jgi:hypothetical protein